MSMNEKERIELTKMIREYGTEDMTTAIRNAQHSSRIKEDVERIRQLHTEYKRLKETNPSQFRRICETRCSFLYENYMEIFNKLVKDQLNYEMMYTLIRILSQIEKGELDQHMASFKVGQILKEMYIDSAIRYEKQEKMKKRRRNKKTNVKPQPKNLTWKEYKQKILKEE